jgi:hypothetical protein
MTPVKIWFKPSKKDGLNLTDCNVLNTAARLLCRLSSTPSCASQEAPLAGRSKPSEADLAGLRKAYKRGMTPSQLLITLDANS